MSEQKEIELVNNPEDLIYIDKVIKTFEEKKSQTDNIVLTAASRAKAMLLLKQAMPDEFVSGIKRGLENSRLGFRTDRKDGYELSIIRNCLIEAAFMGIPWDGNRFNIIANNFYLTKEGLQGLMNQDPDFTDLKIKYGIPEFDVENKRATIKFEATWKYKGKKDQLEDTLPVIIQIWKDKKTGQIVRSTDDAVIGKAERKIRKRVWEKIKGDTFLEGDADDDLENGRIYKNGQFTNADNVDYTVDNGEIRKPEELQKWFKKESDALTHSKPLTQNEYSILNSFLNCFVNDNKEKLEKLVLFLTGRKMEKLVTGHYWAFQAWIGFVEDDLEYLKTNEWIPSDRAIKEAELIFGEKKS